MSLTRIAEAYADHLAREPRFDGRRQAVGNPVKARYLPKKELGEYRDGVRIPSSVVAFRIGEALRDLGVTSASGPLALCAAGHYTDAIAVLGLRGGWNLVTAFFSAADSALNTETPARSRGAHKRNDQRDRPVADPAFLAQAHAAVVSLASDSDGRVDLTREQRKIVERGRQHLLRRTPEIGQQFLAKINAHIGDGFSDAASRWFSPTGTDNEEKERRRKRALQDLAKREPSARLAYDVVSRAPSLEGCQRLLRMLIIHSDDLKGVIYDTRKQRPERDQNEDA